MVNYIVDHRRILFGKQYRHIAILRYADIDDIDDIDDIEFYLTFYKSKALSPLLHQIL